MAALERELAELAALVQENQKDVSAIRFKMDKAVAEGNMPVARFYDNHLQWLLRMGSGYRNQMRIVKDYHDRKQERAFQESELSASNGEHFLNGHQQLDLSLGAENGQRKRLSKPSEVPE
ncbi:hypothetical protein HDU81_003554 [Chytriomyces hyalinus]|nr:hypothetical protein HDU81_003554 [Chytriomyces hyalinus]